MPKSLPPPPNNLLFISGAAFPKTQEKIFLPPNLFTHPGIRFPPFNKPLAHFPSSPILKTLFRNPEPSFLTMSQHRSLKTAGSVGTKRSVLKRGERIKLMKARGQWKEGRLPTNLPKTKSE
ncbi:small basic protein [Prosthecobacter sp. SYSU 5D2]